MPDGVWILLAVISLGGLIGGYAQYLTMAAPAAEPPAPGEPASPAPSPAAHSLTQLLTLGVVASACVPLFLSVVQSTLIAKVLAGSPVDFQQILIFGGFCLVAAFSSRRFIDAVSASVLQRLDEVKADAKEAKADAKKANATAQHVARETDSEAADDAKEPPPPEAAEELKGTALEAQKQPVAPQERKVLEALTKRTYRTRHGIAEDSGMTKPRVTQILAGLEERKLALPTRSPTTGGGRWIITKGGEAALKARS